MAAVKPRLVASSKSNIATRPLRYDDPMKIKRLIRTMDAATAFEGKFRRMFLLIDAHEC